MNKQTRLSSLAGILCGGCLLSSCEKSSSSSMPTPVAQVPAPKPTPSALSIQMPFEGEIQLQLVEPHEKAPKSIVYEVKADRVRYEEGGSSAPAYTIANLSQKKAYAVTDPRKDYIEVDADAAGAKPTDAVQVRKTGRTETVAGYECEDWKITSAKEDLDICAAKEIPYFDLVSPTPATATEPAWAGELTKAKAFPLRVIAHDKSGKERFRAEVSRISRKTVDLARFTIPAGYRKVAVSKDTAVFGLE